MENTARLGLPYLIASQAQKHVTHNDALRDLDALVQLAAKDIGVNAMPSAPEEGDRYIIGREPVGDWAFYADHLASYQDGYWAYFTPREGWQCWLESTASIYIFTEGAWLALASGGAMTGAEMFGINTEADSTNRFAVKSDAVLLSHDDITPGNGDVRLVLNKANEIGTASLLFQTGYSGRAELGLTGNDALSLRVSHNGADWQNGFAIDPQTAAVCFGTTTDFTQALNVTGADPILRVSNTADNRAGLEIVDAQDATAKHFSMFYHSGEHMAAFWLDQKLVAQFTQDGLTVTDHLNVGHMLSANHIYCRNRSLIMNNNDGLEADHEASETLDHIWNSDMGGVWHFCSNTSYRANGNAVVRAGSFEITSDYRLKDNIAPLDPQDAISRLIALKPIAFDWKKEANMKSAPSTEGFLAHELADYVPSAVSGEKDAMQGNGQAPHYQSADYSQVIPLIVAALQGALEKITHLENQLVLKAS